MPIKNAAAIDNNFSPSIISPKDNLDKKVMQVIDHCTIYFFISGTYTPILLSAFLPVYPKLA